VPFILYGEAMLPQLRKGDVLFFIRQLLGARKI